MYACRLMLKIKANSAVECANLIKAEVIPLLHSQNGFCAEATFVVAERLEAHANSLWATRESAEAYVRTAHPRVLEILAGVTTLSSTMEIKESPESRLT